MNRYVKQISGKCKAAGIKVMMGEAAAKMM
jgi:hypothetical protein